MDTSAVVSTTTLLGELALILLAAKAMGLLAKKINVPQVVGELLAGLLIGPCILGLVAGNSFLDKAAEIGVVLLMFYAGLQTNLKDLKHAGGKAFLIATGGVILPLICGTLLYMAFFGFGGPGSPVFTAALFIGAVLTATSVSITVQALRDLDKLQGEVGTAIISAAIIDDVLGILVLTLVSDLTGVGGGGAQSGIQWTLIKTVLFFALSIGAGFVLNKVFRWMEKKYPDTPRIAIFGLVLCFGLAWVADSFFGIADITGAYVAGVMLCTIEDRNYIGDKVDSTGYMFFGPIFFASIGLKTNLSGFSVSLLWFTLALILVALAAKLVGCGSVARLFGFSGKDSLRVGVGMMTRGEVALIVAQKAVDSGALDSKFLAPIILLIVASAVITPIALRAVFKEKKPA